jgi:predicted XRE-type DNA-binding protein
MRAKYTSEQFSAAFWSRVDRSHDGCWLWLGATVHRGYGCCSVNGKTRTTHRVSWELTNGAIPEGLWVLHRCDTPPCVRPDHLYLGTRSDNLRDRVTRGRQIRGEQAWNAKLTVAIVTDIRARLTRQESAASIATLYGIQRSHVKHIRNGRLWRHSRE